MPTEGNDSWLLHSFYTWTGWDGDCVWLEAAGMMNAIIFLVGRAQSYSTLPGQLVHFYPPPQLLPSQKEVLHHLVPGNPPEPCSAETKKASLGQFSSARLGQKHWPIL